MQTISIKSGTSAKVYITPKINGVTATSEQLAGMTLYVFFIYHFTNKIYGTPYKLTPDSSYDSTHRLVINLDAKDTIEMLGNAEENQRFEMQFAIKKSDGEVISDAIRSNVTINIVRWEAGIWLNQ